MQLIGNLLTLVLLLTNRDQSLLQLAHNDSVGDSFHRLCADECINDDETISLLSQQLSCSAASTNHNNNNLSHSQRATRGIPSPAQSPQLVAPSVLSLDSLHLSSQRSLASPAPSYRTLLPCYDQQQHQHHHPLGAWPAATAPSVAPTGYGWPQQQQGGAAASVYERRRPVAQQQQQQSLRQSLLLPSRLEQRNGEVSAWVHATATCNSPLTDLLEQPSTTNLLQQQQQQLSRTSSQSSGFESQTGNNNNNGAGAATCAVGFWGNVQQHQQQQQLQAPHVATSDYGWGDLSQRGLRIPAPLPSPYSTQSEMGFGRVGSVATAQSQQQQHELRPGDLLRKWMDRNAVGMPKTNG